MDEYSIICLDCDWEGSEMELHARTEDLDDTDFVCCPQCGSENLDETDYDD